MTYFAIAFLIVPIYALAAFLYQVFSDPVDDDCG